MRRRNHSTIASAGKRRRGRPPKPGAGVSHLKRPRLSSRHPVHVTLRVKSSVQSLRTPPMFAALHAALSAASERHGMRICHYSVQSNHFHFIVEAADEASLSRGMQALAVRLARRINRRMRRKGSVFRDRYHARALKTALQVRVALRYVLLNARKHAQRSRERDELARISSGDPRWIAQIPERRRQPYPIGPTHCPHIDPYSSALWFRGWHTHPRGSPADELLASAASAPLGARDPRLRTRAPEVAPPKTRLLRRDWVSWGALRTDEEPAGRDLTRLHP